MTAVDCTMVDCAPVECKNGMVPAMWDDGCCPYCDYVSYCDEVDCPDVSCAENETAIVLANEC